MKLGIGTHPLPRDKPVELQPGVVHLPSAQKHAAVKVYDLETGETVENVAAFIWGPGEGFAGAIEAPGLFDSEHFEEGKDYVLIAFQCDAMQEFEEPPA